MNKLHESVDINKLYFKYEGNTKNVTFYEYMDSKELFYKIKNNQIKFDDALKKQKLFLNKLNEVKMGRKTSEQKEVITNLENFCKSREEVFNFFRDYTKICLILNTKQNKMKRKEQDLKY